MVTMYLRRRVARRESRSTLARQLSPSPVRRPVQQEHMKRRGQGRVKREIPDPNPSYKHGRRGLRMPERPRNLNAKDNTGKSLLHRAVERLNSEEVRTLLIAGADPDIVDNDNNTVFHALMNFGKDKPDKSAIVEIARWLLIIGCDYYRTDNLGNTVLHLAFQYALADVILLMIDYKLMFQILNRKGLDPVCNALKYWSNVKRNLRFHPNILVNDILVFEKYHKMIIQQIRCLNISIFAGVNLMKLGSGDNTPILCVFQGVEHSCIIQLLLSNEAQVDFQHPYVKQTLNSLAPTCAENRIPLLLMWYAALYEDCSIECVKNFNPDKLTPLLRKPYESFKNQVEYMKKNTIFGNTKIIELLHESTRERLVNIDDVKFNMILLSERQIIPNYINFLEKKLKITKLKLEQRQSAYRGIDNVLGLGFPTHHIVYDNIMKSLAPLDINILRSMQ